MEHIDFEKHNDEVREVWRAYRQGNPVRVPMTLGSSARFYLSNPRLNTRGITYEEFHTNPDTMLEVQLAHQYYRRHNIVADHEMGLPEEWAVFVAGGNFR